MKQLVQLSNDFIIKTRFDADLDNDKKPVWADKEKIVAIGKNEVINIEMFVPVYDSDGYHYDQYRKVELSKNDILKLAEKIKQIESETVKDTYSERMPF